MDRRSFLRSAAAAGVFNIVHAKVLWSAMAPSNRLTRALVGFCVIAAMLHQKADFEFSASAERDVAKSSFALGYGEGDVCDKSVVHTRTVEFVKNRGIPFFRVTDNLAAKDNKKHTYEQLWHLETCELDMKDTSFIADFGDGVMLEAAFRSENGLLEDMMGRKDPALQGWMPIFAPGPHEHRPIHTPVLKGTFIGNAEIVSVFRPQCVKQNKEGNVAKKQVQSSGEIECWESVRFV